MRIDLHCHSKYSRKPTLWLMKKVGCPESFTEPRAIYDRMRANGMAAVTITDHNVIDGCLEIADLPRAFISEEVTTYFPEDECQVHVLVYDITPTQHEKIQKVRRNIFAFTDYIRAQGIRHVLAHPLFGVNDRLTMAHVEKLLVLYNHLEFNGEQTSVCNDRLRALADVIDEPVIKQLAQKHELPVYGHEPWRKRFTGGSDDHSGLHLGTTYTEVKGARELDEFWQGVDEGRAHVVNYDFTPSTMAHNVYGIGYQYYRHVSGIDRLTNKDIFLKYLDRVLRHEPETKGGVVSRLSLRLSRGLGKRREKRARKKPKRGHEPTIMELVRQEAHRMIREDPALMRLVLRGTHDGDYLEEAWFDFVNQVSNRVLLHFSGTMTDRLLRMHVLDVFTCIGSAGALYAVLAPYFVAYAIHGKVRRFSAEVVNRFGAEDPCATESMRVAHLYDTFDAAQRTPDAVLACAEAAGKKGVMHSAMTAAHVMRANVTTFHPIGEHPFGEGKHLRFPPLLEFLRHLYDENYTHIHVETPGPMGLAAMAAGRILGIPVSATFHDALPTWAQRATGDTYVEDMMWKYLAWYYAQMSGVIVDSEAQAKDLIDRGIDENKIHIVDPEAEDTTSPVLEMWGQLTARPADPDLSDFAAGSLPRLNEDLAPDA